MKQKEVSQLLAGLVEAQVALAKSIEATASALVASQGEALTSEDERWRRKYCLTEASRERLQENRQKACSCQAHRGNKNLGFGSPTPKHNQSSIVSLAVIAS